MAVRMSMPWKPEKYVNMHCRHASPAGAHQAPKRTRFQCWSHARENSQLGASSVTRRLGYHSAFEEEHPVASVVGQKYMAGRTRCNYRSEIHGR